MLTSACGTLTILTALHFGLLGCSDDDECALGTTRSCSAEENCEAEQVCQGRPGRWSSCECTESEDEPIASKVGEGCFQDSNCAEDETCFEPDDDGFLGGSPVTGFCTLRCDQDPSRCERRTPESVCVVTDDQGTENTDDDTAHCLQACPIGADPEGKCQDNQRLACAALSTFDGSTALRAMTGGPDEDDTNERRTNKQGANEPSPGEHRGVCRPLCSNHDDCGVDRFCNRRTGACQNEARPGLPFGRPCSPDSSATPEDESCEGICVEVEGASFCSQRCWFGSADNCSELPLDDTEADLRPGFCRFPEHPDGLIGDVGFCTPLCTCHDDCGHPDLVCQALDRELAAILHSPGVCISRNSEAREPEADLSCEQQPGDAGSTN